MSEQEQTALLLRGIQRPPFVTDIRYSLEDDWSGDPAILFWVILQDDIAASQNILEHTQPIRNTIVHALRDAGIHRWPYVRFRSQSEQAELDQAAAA